LYYNQAHEAGANLLTYMIPRLLKLLLALCFYAAIRLILLARYGLKDESFL
jgi:hypothetical protein